MTGHCSSGAAEMISASARKEGQSRFFIHGCRHSLITSHSLRAWRELRYNRKYAEKLEKKLARLKEKEVQQTKAATDATEKTSLQSNPFAVSLPIIWPSLFTGGIVDALRAQMNSATSSNLFGLGSQIFGGAVLDSSAESSTLDSRTESRDRNGSLSASVESESEGEDSGDEDEDALAAAVQSTSLEDTPWKDAPGYPPLYLSTISEYLPTPSKVKMPAKVTADSDGDRDSKNGGGGWGIEGYENSMEVDHAFERFSQRVSYEGEQCLRYASGGIDSNHRT